MNTLVDEGLRSGLKWETVVEGNDRGYVEKGSLELSFYEIMGLAYRRLKLAVFFVCYATALGTGTCWQVERSVIIKFKVGSKQIQFRFLREAYEEFKWMSYLPTSSLILMPWLLWLRPKNSTRTVSRL